jgi:hypothetical protein
MAYNGANIKPGSGQRRWAGSEMSDAARTPLDEWGLTSVVDELGADEARVWRASLNFEKDRFRLYRSPAWPIAIYI